MIAQFSATGITWYCGSCHRQNDGQTIFCECGDGKRPRDAAVGTTSTRWWCVACHRLNLGHTIICDCGSRRWERLGIAFDDARRLLWRIISL